MIFGMQLLTCWKESHFCGWVCNLYWCLNTKYITYCRNFIQWERQWNPVHCKQDPRKIQFCFKQIMVGCHNVIRVYVNSLKALCGRWPVCYCGYMTLYPLFQSIGRPVIGWKFLLETWKNKLWSSEPLHPLRNIGWDQEYINNWAKSMIKRNNEIKRTGLQTGRRRHKYLTYWLSSYQLEINFKWFWKTFFSKFQKN